MPPRLLRGPALETPMKLLLAHDGSPQADALIADLPRCGLPSSGTAVVLSVADAWTSIEGDAAPTPTAAGAGSAQILRAALQAAQQTAQRGLQAARSMLPGWTVEAETVAGSPAWEIVRKADEWLPDLVMIGSTGASPLERLVFGTVTSQVIEHARTSVRTCRPRAGATGPVKLLLATDGSPDSDRTARHVASRSWPPGTVVRVLTAVDARLLGSIASEAGEDAARARAEALPDEAANLLRQSGLTVETQAVEGDPKRLLAETAKAWGADCIFLGAQGRTGLARLLLGSVALATATRATCSVEIVRRMPG